MISADTLQGKDMFKDKIPNWMPAFTSLEAPTGRLNWEVILAKRHSIHPNVTVLPGSTRAPFRLINLTRNSGYFHK